MVIRKPRKNGGWMVVGLYTLDHYSNRCKVLVLVGSLSLYPRKVPPKKTPASKTRLGKKTCSSTFNESWYVSSYPLRILTPQEFAILRYFEDPKTPLLYRFIHPSIQGSKDSYKIHDINSKGVSCLVKGRIPNQKSNLRPEGIQYEYVKIPRSPRSPLKFLRWKTKGLMTSVL